MKRLLILTLACGLIFVSCGISKSKHNELQEKVNSLKQENKDLKLKIQDAMFKVSDLKKEHKKLENSPFRLLALGKKLFKEKEYEKSFQALFKLSKEHPKSKEAKQGAALYKRVDNILTAMEREKVRKRKQAIRKAMAGLRRIRAGTYVDPAADRLSGTNIALQLKFDGKSKPSLSLVLTYEGYWELLMYQFFFEVKLYGKSKIHTIEFDASTRPAGFKSEYSGKYVEIRVQSVYQKEMKLVKDLAYTDVAVVLIHGVARRSTHVLSKTELRGINRVYFTYEKLLEYF
jgi:hypothetical protein